MSYEVTLGNVSPTQYASNNYLSYVDDENDLRDTKLNKLAQRTLHQTNTNTRYQQSLSDRVVLCKGPPDRNSGRTIEHETKMSGGTDWDSYGKQSTDLTFKQNMNAKDPQTGKEYSMGLSGGITKKEDENPSYNVRVEVGFKY